MKLFHVKLGTYLVMSQQYNQNIPRSLRETKHVEDQLTCPPQIWQILASAVSDDDGDVMEIPDNVNYEQRPKNRGHQKAIINTLVFTTLGEAFFITIWGPLELVTLVYETQNVPNSVLAFLIFEKSEI